MVFGILSLLYFKTEKYLWYVPVLKCVLFIKYILYNLTASNKGPTRCHAPVMQTVD